jgi:photosystem II stability/assembly factor-like uncharacterized protein
LSEIGVTNDVETIRLVGSVAYIGGTGGLLCISTNNGASWQAFETNTDSTFNDLAFYDSQRGFAVGTAGIICVYDGRSWVPQITDTTETFHGVAVAGDAAGAVGTGGLICRYNGTR